MDDRSEDYPVALTIAGSDSSGGAGIQADLKTFTRLGVYGMSVVTSITVQNTVGVHGVHDVDGDLVAAQLSAVLEDIPPAATKIGALVSAGNVEAVAAQADRRHLGWIVLDPVMRSSSGMAMLSRDAEASLRERLLPRVSLITPNLDEAERLVEARVRTRSEMEEAARQMHQMGAGYVLVKGGHLEGDRIVDIFFDGQTITALTGERIQNPQRHGTGCVLSAATTAYLALGLDMESAVARAHVLTRRAIQNGLRLGHGVGPCDPVGLRTLTTERVD